MYPLIYQPYAREFPLKYYGLYAAKTEYSGSCSIEGHRGFRRYYLIDGVKVYEEFVPLEYKVFNEEEFLTKKRRFLSSKEMFMNNYGLRNLLEFCNSYYGEENVDLQFNSFSFIADVVIFFNQISISSEDNENFKVDNFYFKITYSAPENRIISLKGGCSNFKFSQLLDLKDCNGQELYYIHSHIKSKTLKAIMDGGFFEFCTGNGDTISSSIKTDFFPEGCNLLPLENFVIHIQDFLAHESTEGGPYIAIKTIKSTNSNSGDNAQLRRIIFPIADFFTQLHNKVDNDLTKDSLFFLGNYDTYFDKILISYSSKDNIYLSIHPLLEFILELFIKVVEDNDFIDDSNTIRYLDVDPTLKSGIINAFSRIIEYKNIETGDIITVKEYLNIPEDFLPETYTSEFRENKENPLFIFKNKKKYAKVETTKPFKGEKRLYRAQIRSRSKEFYNRSIEEFEFKNREYLKKKTLYRDEEFIQTFHIESFSEVVSRAMST